MVEAGRGGFLLQSLGEGMMLRMTVVRNNYKEPELFRGDSCPWLLSRIQARYKGCPPYSKCSILGRQGSAKACNRNRNRNHCLKSLKFGYGDT